ncbi:MAG: hypothetical protein D6701_05810, partial [Gemmatimonadetes bacterium]
VAAVRALARLEREALRLGEDGEALRTLARGALVSAVDDPHPYVRATAARALARVGAPDAVAAYRRWSTREAARRRLDPLGPERVLVPRATALGPRPPTAEWMEGLTLTRSIPLAAPGATLLATIHRSAGRRPPELSLWRIEADGAFRRLVRWVADEGADFAPEPFAARWTTTSGVGVPLVVLDLAHAGTAAAHTRRVYAVDPLGELHPVPVEDPVGVYAPRLAGDAEVWKGALLDLRPEAASFEFWVWRPGDANCCPSGGRVHGRLELRGALHPVEGGRAYASTLRLTPVAFEHIAGR